MQNKLKLLFIVILIFCLPYLLFWRLWVSNDEYRYTLAGDLVEATYPVSYFYANSLHDEKIPPLWNPYVLSGAPLIGDFQTTYLYPPDILQNLFFKKEVAKFFSVYEKKIILHLSLAGIFMFLLMRMGFGLKTVSSFIASIIFMFNQSLLRAISPYHSFIAVVWFPLILLFAWRYYLTRKLRYSLFGAVSLGVALLTNTIQSLYYLCILLGVISIFLIIQQLKQKQLNSKTISGWFLIFIVAFGIAAAQLLPLYEFLTKYSVRSGHVSYQFSTYNQMPFKGMILSYLIPFNPNQYYSGYLGIFSLFLILLGIIFYRHPLKKFFLSLIFFIWIVAAGHYFFLNDFLYLFLPGYSSMHVHGRLLIYQTVFLAILAGFGVEFLNSKVLPRQKKILYILSLIFTGFILAFFGFLMFKVINFIFLIKQNPFSGFTKDLVTGPLLDKIDAQFFIFVFLGLSIVVFWSRLFGFFKRRGLNFFISGLVLLDLLSVATLMQLSYNLTKSPYYSSVLPVKEVFRDLPHLNYKALTAWEGEANDSIEDIVNKRSSAYHLTNLYSKNCIYDGYYLPAALKRYARYLAYADPAIIIPPGHLEFIQTTNKEKHPQLMRLITGKRVYIVPRAIVEKDENKILEGLSSLDLEKEIILEESPLVTSQKDEIVLNKDEKTNFKFTKFSNNTVELDVYIPWTYGYLLYVDNWYPGWKAYVDDKETKVYRANYTFKSVVVPYGEHRVNFSFKPLSFKVGIYITIFTLASSIISLIKIKTRSC